MTVIEFKEATGIKYAIRCACGFLGASRATLVAAGAEIDKHQAEVFPRPSERRECSGAPGEFPEDVWGALHHVWTWAVGKPGYRKSAFQLLERDLLTMHVSEQVLLAGTMAGTEPLILEMSRLWISKLAGTVNSDSPDSEKGEGAQSKSMKTKLTTSEIIDRFQALCREIGCSVYLHKEDDGNFRMDVDRDGRGIQTEAHIIAITPGRLVWRPSEKAVR